MQDHIDDMSELRPCPAWCQGEHPPGRHAEDQHHTSGSRRIALVSGDPVLDPDDLAVPGAVVARLIQRRCSEVTWLEVVSEEGRAIRMVITVGSARQLLAVLQGLVSAAAST
jgi:hypothetical protein